jgi:hypothetical protein
MDGVWVYLLKLSEEGNLPFGSDAVQVDEVVMGTYSEHGLLWGVSHAFNPFLTLRESVDFVV